MSEVVGKSRETTDEAVCSRKVASGRRVAGAIRSLANTRSLQLECARVLHESLLMPVLTYDTETMIRKEERSRIRAVQMDNLRGLLGIRKMGKVPNPPNTPSSYSYLH